MSQELYNQRMEDDTLWGGTDPPRYSPKSVGFHTRDFLATVNNGKWISAFMDCLLEKREYVLIKDRSKFV